MLPTQTTSIEKMVADIGVPSIAAKPADIPLIIISFLSFLSNFSNEENPLPILPPIKSAEPVRPAEPPHKCVRVAAIIMSGVRIKGIGFSSAVSEESIEADF